jgi:pimeloyl-ACP methyl ester carboxylesterase
MRRAAAAFGVSGVEVFEWSGENSTRAREDASTALAHSLAGRATPVHLLGFSHGGNIARSAAALLPPGSVETLVTIATPVLPRRPYQPIAGMTHIHLYSDRDLMQRGGGDWLHIPRLGSVGLAKRLYPLGQGVRNIRIEGLPSPNFTGRHGDILWWDETWVRLEEALRLPSHNILE